MGWLERGSGWEKLGSGVSASNLKLGPCGLTARLGMQRVLAWPPRRRQRQPVLAWGQWEWPQGRQPSVFGREPLLSWQPRTPAPLLPAHPHPRPRSPVGVSGAGCPPPARPRPGALLELTLCAAGVNLLHFTHLIGAAGAHHHHLPRGDQRCFAAGRVGSACGARGGAQGGARRVTGTRGRGLCSRAGHVALVSWGACRGLFWGCPPSSCSSPAVLGATAR